MKKMNKKIISVVVIALMLVIGFSTYWSTKDSNSISIGSVVNSSEYLSTTTVSTSAGTFWVAKSLANSGANVCVLGSVVVASSSATTLTLWNATSTTDVSSSTITALKASIGEGTYTYDITCSRGLIVETPTGFNGNYTITFK